RPGDDLGAQRSAAAEAPQRRRVTQRGAGSIRRRLTSSSNRRSSGRGEVLRLAPPTSQHVPYGARNGDLQVGTQRCAVSQSKRVLEDGRQSADLKVAATCVFVSKSVADAWS